MPESPATHGHIPVCHPGRDGPVTWLVAGRLGGMPRPGRSGAGIEADLKALRDLGVSMVVTLTEEWAPPDGLFEAFGLKAVHVPIPDWQPPRLWQAERTCDTVAAALAGGASVVFHCQAGRGRTGTMLAAMLIREGAGFTAAVDRVKSVNPDWIESESQMRFLKDFDRYRRGRGARWPQDGSRQGNEGTDDAR